MSPAVRVRVVAGAAAVATAAVVVGVVAATRQDPAQPAARSCSPLKPYFVGGTISTQAAAVRHAFSLSSSNKAAIAMEPLAQLAPGDPAVQFNYGLALYCAGYLAEAVQAFQAAKAAGSDTFYEIRADSILHPQYFSQGYPIFEPEGRVDALLRQGVAEQTAGHQHSAERLYARAARLHPADDQAQVAAAVGRFNESNLAASFSRLGPLVKRFPTSISVRYHLGLLLAWTGQRTQALVEFREAKRLGPHTELGREANAFVERLVTDRTDRTQR